MAFTYGFYNSLNGDRRYDSIQMSSIFDGIIRDGIFMSIGTQMMVKAAQGMMVTVGTGRGWFDHTWSLNDAEFPVTLDQAEVIQDRIDIIVLDVDRSEAVRKNSIIFVKGEPSSNPEPPTLIKTQTHKQYTLAEIRVNRGVTVINQADITNKVGTGETPFVTGLLDTINIDDLIAQWGDQWFQFYNNQTTQIIQQAEAFAVYISQFKSQSETDWNTWFDAFKNSSITNFEDLEQQIHDILDEGAAGALLNMINDHIRQSVNDEDGVHEIRQKDGYLQTYRDGAWSGVAADFMLPNLKRFVAGAASNTSISLIWEDPDDISLDTLALAQWNSTRILRRFDRYPVNENDGDLVVETTIRNQYSETPYLDEGLIFGQEYFYSAFPISKSNIVNRNEANRASAETGAIPPGDVTGLRAVGSSESIILYWSDPEDTVLPTVTWAGTRVMRKQGGYPVDEFDGTLVVDNTVRDQYATTGFVDTGLETDEEYFYQAFPYSTTGAVNRDESNRVSAVVSGGYKVYGVRIDESDSDPAAAVTYTDDAIEFEWKKREGYDRDWSSICYAEDKEMFVAISRTGYGMYSYDGVDWVEFRAVNNTTYQFMSVTYGNGMFVMVGATGIVAYSEDGINWTARVAVANDAQWYAVTYGAGLFVAVAYGNTNQTIMTSPDGINWTARSSSTYSGWQDIIYGAGKFVAVSTNTNLNAPNIQYSSTGTSNWSTITVSTRNLRSIAYGNDMFVVVGGRTNGVEAIITSSDGTTWTDRSTGRYEIWTKVIYASDMFIALGNSGNIMTSSDGINWTYRSTGFNTPRTTIAYGKGLFVGLATGDGKQTVLTTTDPTAIDKTFINDIRPCLLGSTRGGEIGEIIGYLNPNNYAKFEDGTDANITYDGPGDVMIEIPKMAYLIDREDDDTVIIKVTDHPRAKELDERFCYFAHSWEIEGDCSHIYIGAYLANAGPPLVSTSAGTPRAQRLSEALSTAKSNGDHYTLGHTHFELTLLQALYIIRFKTRNGRTVAGAGRAAGTTGVGNTAGMFSSDGTAKIFGIEDFWFGSVHTQWITGFIMNDRSARYSFGKNISATPTDKWVLIDNNVSIFPQNYFAKIKATNELNFLPDSGSGSISTNWCSNSVVTHISGSADTAYVVGYNSSAHSNLFTKTVASPTSSFHGRLMYFKEG